VEIRWVVTIMSFLQPLMLWALPAVLLPLVIHLLNRLRYKTVHWAAMMFLFKANKAATRRAKIRQYLLLVSRMALLLFFLWAMARPLVGGWIGSAAGGAPDTVLILLDRSSSMEATGRDRQESKRAHALTLLTQAAKQSEGSRFVLIENALRQPLEIANAAALSSMSMAGPTDSAADIPSMILAALEYLTKNTPGNAEIWIASDLQTSNWRPESPDWTDLMARFAGLPQETRVRVLDLSTPLTSNASLALQSAELRVNPADKTKGQAALALEIQSTGITGNLPLFITRDDGSKTQYDIPLSSATQRQVVTFDVAKIESLGGYGKVELAADENSADHTAYFAYAPPVPLLSVVVGDQPSMPRMKVSAAPDPSRKERRAELLPMARAESIPWKDAAMIVWQGGAPTDAVAKQLDAFVQSGGMLFCLPPASDATTGPLGLTWNTVESAPAETSFRVTTWDDLDGPLAKTDNGTPLSIARMDVQRRQIPSLNHPSTHVSASFADGLTFLAGRKIGAGYLYACATLPDSTWGSLGEGFVLLPMTQRLLTMGARRLAPPLIETVGNWKPVESDESWTSLDTSGPHDWRWNAGVYQSGAKRIALNRPKLEDDPDVIDAPQIKALLPNAKLEILSSAIEVKADNLQSEIWPLLVVLAMAAMCVEMLLATSKGMLPVKLKSASTAA
jgi:hypothetical protein